eukprot:COSAG01_NODE_1376_length_10535_cov_103.374856_5_plen_105_part_00
MPFILVVVRSHWKCARRAHIGGCLWHYVGLPYSTDSCFNTNGTRKQLLGGCDPPTDSWLVQTDLLESDTIWKKYVLSFYWASAFASASLRHAARFDSRVLLPLR